MAITKLTKEEKQILNTQKSQNERDSTMKFVQNGGTNPNQLEYDAARANRAYLNFAENVRLYGQSGRTSTLTWDELGVSPDYGRSKYDRYIKTLSQMQNPNETRAQAQSGVAKLGLGLTQMVTRAGITALNSITTLPAMGIFAIAGNKNENVLTRAIANPISMGLAQLDELTRNVLPIYRHEWETDENAPFFKRMTTAGWWAEDLLSNAGFTIGAMVGGKGVGQAVEWTAQKLTKMGAAKAFAKIYATSGKAGVEQFIKQNAGKSTQEIGKAIQTVNTSTTTRTAASTIVGMLANAASESQIEAIQNRKNFLEENINHIANYWNTENPSARLTYQDDLANGRTSLNFEDYVQEQRNKMLEKVQQYGDQILNNTFLMETVLLTATNSMAFKNWYDVSFRMSHSQLQKSKPFLRFQTEVRKTKTNPIRWDKKTFQTTIKNKVKNGHAKEIIGMSEKSNLPYVIASYAKPFLAEGGEEMAQAGISEGLRQHFGSRINDVYEHLNMQENPIYSDTILNWFQSFATGVGSMFTSQSLMEGFVGGLMGIVGLPGRKLSRKMRKAQNVSFWKNIQMQGGAWDVHRELKAQRETARNFVKTFQEIVKDTGKGSKLASTIRDFAALAAEQDIQQIAQLANDKRKYLDSKNQEFIKLLSLYDNLGMIDDFMDIFQTVVNNPSEEDKQLLLTQIKEYYNAVQDPNAEAQTDNSVQTRSITDEEAEQILQKVQKNAQRQLEAIKEYQQIKEQIYSLSSYVQDVNTEKVQKALNVVLNNYMTARNLEVRLADLDQKDTIQRVKTILDQKRTNKDEPFSISKFLEENFPEILNLDKKLKTDNPLDQIISYAQLSMNFNQMLHEWLKDTNFTPQQLKEISQDIFDYYTMEKEFKQRFEIATDNINGIIDFEKAQTVIDNVINEAKESESVASLEKFKQMVDDTNFKIQNDADKEKYNNIVAEILKIGEDIYNDSETTWNELKELAMKRNANKSFLNPKLNFFVSLLINKFQLQHTLDGLRKRYLQVNSNDSHISKINQLFEIPIQQIDEYINDKLQHTIDPLDQTDWQDILNELKTRSWYQYITQEALQKRQTNISTHTNNTKTITVKDDGAIASWEVPTQIQNDNVQFETEQQSELEHLIEGFEQTQTTIINVLKSEPINKKKQYDCKFQNNILSLSQTFLNTIWTFSYNFATNKIDIFQKNTHVGTIDNLQKCVSDTKYFAQQIGTLKMHESGSKDADVKEDDAVNLSQLLQAFQVNVTNLLEQNAHNKIPLVVLLSADIEKLSSVQFDPSDAQDKQAIDNYYQLINYVTKTTFKSKTTNVVTKQQLHKRYENLQRTYTENEIVNLKTFAKQFPTAGFDRNDDKLGMSDVLYQTIIQERIDQNPTLTLNDIQLYARNHGYYVEIDEDTAQIKNITFFEGQNDTPYTIEALRNAKGSFSIGSTIKLKLPNSSLIDTLKITDVNNNGYIISATGTHTLLAYNTNENRVYLQPHAQGLSEEGIKDKDVKSVNACLPISEYDVAFYTNELDNDGNSVKDEKGKVKQQRHINDKATRTLTKESSKYKDAANTELSEAIYDELQEVYDYLNTGKFFNDYYTYLETHDNQAPLVHFRLIEKELTDDVKKLLFLQGIYTDITKIKLIEAYIDFDGQQKRIGILDPRKQNGQGALIEKLFKNGLNENEFKYTTTLRLSDDNTNNPLWTGNERAIVDGKSAATTLLTDLYHPQENNLTQSSDDTSTPLVVFLTSANGNVQVHSSQELSQTQIDAIKTVHESHNMNLGTLYVLPYNSTNNEIAKQIQPQEIHLAAFTDVIDYVDEILPAFKELTNRDNYQSKEAFQEMCNQALIELKNVFFSNKGSEQNLTQRYLRIVGNFDAKTITIQYVHKTDTGEEVITGIGDKYAAGAAQSVTFNPNDANFNPQETIYSVFLNWLKEFNPTFNITPFIFHKENLHTTNVKLKQNSLSYNSLLKYGILNTHLISLRTSNTNLYYDEETTKEVAPITPKEQQNAAPGIFKSEEANSTAIKGRTRKPKAKQTQKRKRRFNYRRTNKQNQTVNTSITATNYIEYTPQNQNAIVINHQTCPLHYQLQMGNNIVYIVKLDDGYGLKMNFNATSFIRDTNHITDTYTLLHATAQLLQDVGITVNQIYYSTDKLASDKFLNRWNEIAEELNNNKVFNWDDSISNTSTTVQQPLTEPSQSSEQTTTATDEVSVSDDENVNESDDNEELQINQNEKPKNDFREYFKTELLKPLRDKGVDENTLETFVDTVFQSLTQDTVPANELGQVINNLLDNPQAVMNDLENFLGDNLDELEQLAQQLQTDPTVTDSCL